MSNVVPFDRERPRPPKSPFGVPPRSDTELEAELLGQAIDKPGAVERLASILKTKHFFAHQHQLMWTAIESLLADGVVVNKMSVTMRLRSTGDYEKLVEPGNAVPIDRMVLDHAIRTGEREGHRLATLEDCAKHLVRLWSLREIGSICWEIAARSYEVGNEPEPLIRDATERLDKLAEASTVREDKATVTEAIGAVFQSIEEQAKSGKPKWCLSTGLTELDYKIIGLFPGELYVLGARPGMGKSALSNHVAMHVAMAQKPPGEPRDGVLYITMEMPIEQQSMRMLSSLSRIGMDSLRTGAMRPDDWRTATAAAARINGAPILLVDKPGQTPLEIRTRARRLQSEWSADVDEHGRPKRRLSLVIVDYLQKLDGRPLAGPKSTRSEQVGACSNALKNLALEMKIPVIALSQVNRASQKSRDKRATMTDLRESGDIEADADAIWMLYRDEYYTKERTKPDKRGLAEISIEKARSGKTGRVFAKFVGYCTAFSDWDGKTPDEDEDDE